VARGEILEDQEFYHLYCDGCGEEDPDLFMVHNWIWGVLEFDWDSIYCFSCTEKRMKEVFCRGFQFSDFTDCPLNKKIQVGYKLGMTESSSDDRFYKGYKLGQQEVSSKELVE
jgi:hypothetical protein